MRMFINDTVFPQGHKSLNNRLLSYLSEQNLIISNNKGYYDENIFPEHSFVETCYSTEGAESLSYRLKASIASIQMLRSYRHSFDKVVYFTFDTLTFALEWPFIRSKEIFLFHHKNTSELNNKKYRIAFSAYANSVHHIVFSEFIASYLINEIKIDRTLIHTLPHPILSKIAGCGLYKRPSNGSVKWIGTGLANDESLISQIIEYEDKTHYLKNNNITLVLRSSRGGGQHGNIRIISGFMDANDYNTLYRESFGVLLLYPYSYVNRFSGVIMDAMAHNKPVVGTRIPIVSEFEKFYPSYCTSFGQIDELFNIIIAKSASNTHLDKNELDLFLTRHSDIEVQKQLIKILSCESF